MDESVQLHERIARLSEQVTAADRRVLELERQLKRERAIEDAFAHLAPLEHLLSEMEHNQDPESASRRLEALITYWERFPGTTYGECARQARESIAADGARDRTSEPEGDRLTVEPLTEDEEQLLQNAEELCDGDEREAQLNAICGLIRKRFPKPQPADPLEQLLAEMERNQDPESASRFWARRVREALRAKESGGCT